jgi:quercetin dioxygenase-like cupin family protein
MLRQWCADEGLHPHSWSNGPHDAYAAHSHSYDKVIFVVRGSITFGLPKSGQELTLKAGDRLNLPAHTVHAAGFGADGAVCLEAHQ